mmetsp:Transcript_255/g.327  ORF Transcript_255/g.327 Transcript_255/m.327 type:complete len:625 (+) Transcript_255:228-2102(+)
MTDQEEERYLLGGSNERWLVIEAKPLDSVRITKRRHLRWAHIIFRVVAGGTIFILTLIVMSHWKQAQAWALSKDIVTPAPSIKPGISSPVPGISSQQSIVLALADDLGYNDFGFASSDMGACTPFVDELMASGIELKNLYASSVCTPSRGSLLTGKYPARLGLQHWQIEPAQSWGLSLNFETMAQWLQRAGYSTIAIGKWHLGHYTAQYTPTQRGFDKFFGFYSGGIDYFTRQAICTQNKECFFDYGDDKDNQSVQFATIEMTSKAIDYLKALNHQPTFLYFALPNSHAPIAPPAWAYREFNQCAQPIQNHARRAFAVLTALWDQALRNISQFYTQENSPVWIVLSDNGADPAFGGSNYPLRGAKKYLFEGGVRVRGFFWSPLFASSTRKRYYTGLFHIADLAPTLIAGFLNRADLLPDDLDGVNHWNQLIHYDDDELSYCRQDEDESKESNYPRNEVLLGLDYLNSTLDYLGYLRMAIIFCDGRYSCFKALYNVEQVFWYLPPSDPDTIIDPTPTNFRYSALYNLSNDPGERRDLQLHFPDIFQALQTKLIQSYSTTMTRAANLPTDFTAFSKWREDTSMNRIKPWRATPISNLCLNLTKTRLQFETEQGLLSPHIDCSSYST